MEIPHNMGAKGANSLCAGRIYPEGYRSAWPIAEKVGCFPRLVGNGTFS
jgi:hypothetical protein